MSGKFKHLDSGEIVVAYRTLDFLQIWNRNSGSVTKAHPGDWVVVVEDSRLSPNITQVINHKQFQNTFRPIDDAAKQELSKEINPNLSYPLFAKEDPSVRKEK